MVFRRRSFRRRGFGGMRRRRSSLKRRYFRRRRGSRFSRRRRSSGKWTKIIKYGNASGRVAYTKHTYCTLLKLAANVTKGYNGWRMNSVYDPDATTGLGQHSANNYLAMVALFNKYMVHKSVLTLKVMPFLGDGDGGGVAMWMERWHTGEPSWQSIGDPTVIAERGNSTLKFVNYNAGSLAHGPSDRTHFFKARYNVWKEQARTKLNIGNYSANVGNNPATESLALFNFVPVNGAFQEGSQIHVWVKIVYWVKWFCPSQQAIHENVV